MAALERLSGAKAAALEANLEERLARLEGLVREQRGHCTTLLARSDDVTGSLAEVAQWKEALEREELVGRLASTEGRADQLERRLEDGHSHLLERFNALEVGGSHLVNAATP
eukprot:634102-Prorocentrum_minimum.AAC.4